MRKYPLFILVFLLLSASCWAQLTIVVPSVPANTPADADIYIAGNFNGWDPGNADYLLTDNGDGSYEISINPSPGQVDYKFTRGSWDLVEGNADGDYQPNHVVNYSGSALTVETPILGWENQGSNSTAADNVQILFEDFYIPQLDRYRRIWLYLPPDYDASSKYYPVLYMHDGQNLFDDLTAFSGEWEVDESLNALHAAGDYGVIVVGIDNGGAARIDEYSPWFNPSYGGGEGDAYLQFIINELKPEIDANFRTLPGREYTGIMGSSLGGLISHYAAIEYQETFGKAGIFSPSFWFAQEVFDHSQAIGKEEDMKLFLLGGELEGGNMVANLNKMEDILLDGGFGAEELKKQTHSDGQHSEWYWAREFPDAYEWLFGNLNISSAYDWEQGPFRLYPNPAATQIQVEIPGSYKKVNLEIRNLEGKRMLRQKIAGEESLNVETLDSGLYMLNLLYKGKLIHTEKVIINR
jgi:predicted alpha/beta superfamily hydrolase